MPKEVKAIFVLLLFILAGTLFVFSQHRATGKAIEATTLRFQMPAEVKVGDIVQVKLAVAGVQNLQGFTVTLQYDAGKLQYEKTELGPFLAGDPPSPVYFDAPQPFPNTLSDARALRQTFDGVSGEGVLLTYIFTAISEGNAPFFAQPVLLMDNTFNEIPVSVDSAEITIIPQCTDADGDGYGENCDQGMDCDDGSAARNPGAAEICGNVIDEDCSGADLPCPLPPPPVPANVSQNVSQNESSPVTAADIGLTAPPFRAVTRPVANIAYQVREKALLTGCTLLLNGKIFQVDTAFQGRFSVPLPSPGNYNWKIVCTSRAGQQIALPTESFHYIKKDKFTGTDILALPSLEGVLNFRLEQAPYGWVQFTKAVDLTRAVDLDQGVSFAQNSITINPSTVAGINQPAQIHLSQVTAKNPQILRDGVPCNPPLCSILALPPALTFTVPGFSTYTVVEASPPQNITPQNRTIVLPKQCTVALSSGMHELEVAQGAVLCLASGAAVRRYQVSSISPSQIRLLQDLPIQQWLLLSSAAPTSIDMNSDGVMDITLEVRQASAEMAVLLVRFKSADNTQVQDTIVVQRTLQESPPQRKSLTASLSGDLNIKADEKAGSRPREERPFNIPVFWIGAVLALFVCVLVIIHGYLAGRQHPLAPEHDPLTPGIQQDLELLGVKPEQAKERLRGKKP